MDDVHPPGQLGHGSRRARADRIIRPVIRSGVRCNTTTMLLFPTMFVNFTSNVASVAFVSARIAVIHYSSTGNVYRLATAIADGAAEEGADVRLRKVRELAPEEAISSNPRWLAHRDAVAELPEATLDDLEWADGFAFGSPTRFGLPAAQLKQFLDQTGGLWARGLLQDKVGTAFTSASTSHGGLEATILAMNTVLYHWGSIVLPLGYTDDAIKLTGNPYGSSWVSRKGSSPDDDALATAHHQGRRLARVAAAVRGTRP